MDISPLFSLSFHFFAQGLAKRSQSMQLIWIQINLFDGLSGESPGMLTKWERDAFSSLDYAEIS